MVIKIRADGGPGIGLGHWSRCIYLASCIEGNCAKILYTKNPDAFNKSFPDSGWEVIAISTEDDFLQGVSKRDVVIIDVYDLDSDFFLSLRSKDAIVVHIDDLLSDWCSDFIINHSLGITPSNYGYAAAYTSFYLGNSFSLVPREFKRDNREDRERIGTLLIAMGGADPTDRTSMIIKENEGFLAGFNEVIVIVGPHYHSFTDLQKLTIAKKNIKLLQGIPRQTVVECMLKAGTAILSSSTMALEYAHIGGLLIIVQTADNQVYLHNGLIESGAAIGVEKLKEVQGNVTSFYASLKNKQEKLFDGLSGSRFNKLFKEVFLQQSLYLRRASVDDAELTFKWATDSTIRAYSFSKNEIRWDDHLAWFNSKVGSADCLYFIGVIDNKPVGSIRFDKVEGTLIVSYLVDCAYHGLGLGRMLLATGIKELIKFGLSQVMVIGYVMAENVPSVKAFQRLGFSQSDGGAKYAGSIMFHKKIV